MRANNLPILII